MNKKTLYFICTIGLFFSILFLLPGCKKKKATFFTINYNCANGGKIYGDKTQIIEQNFDGKEVIAIAEEGYRFLNWSDGAITQNRKDNNIQANLTVTAFFQKIDSFTIKYSCTEGGIIIGCSSQVIEAGQSTNEVEAFPTQGYRFTGWSDGIKTAKRTDENILESKTITALFEKLYMLTVLNSNPDYGYFEGNTTQFLSENELSEEVKAIPNLGYKFNGWSNGSSNENIQISITEDTIIYANFSIEYLELPIVQIFTENRQPIASKTNYLNCNIDILNTNYSHQLNSISGKIRGRGNATWADYPKKPYKIKLDKKYSLLGMDDNKNWELLACYCDKTLLRSAIGYEISKIMGKEYTSDYRFVDLYLNGEYIGIYQLTESIKEGKNRVNISETGYIIENSNYDDKEIKFVTLIGNKLYNFKYPDDEDITQEQLEYISGTMNDFESILFSEDDIAFSSELGYRNYIDVTSFAKWFLINNTMQNLDTNVYYYKFDDTSSSKLYMGPVWDFEWSIGIGWYDGPRGEMEHIIIDNYGYFNRLLEDPYFRTTVKDIWINYVDTLKSQLPNIIMQSSDQMINSINRNFEKWDILNEKISVGGQPLGSYELELECDYNYLMEHIEWLNNIIMTW